LNSNDKRNDILNEIKIPKNIQEEIDKSKITGKLNLSEK
jgi:hypothetical protein